MSFSRCMKEVARISGEYKLSWVELMEGERRKKSWRELGWGARASNYCYCSAWKWDHAVILVSVLSCLVLSCLVWSCTFCFCFVFFWCRRVTIPYHPTTNQINWLYCGGGVSAVADFKVDDDNNNNNNIIIKSVWKYPIIFFFYFVFAIHYKRLVINLPSLCLMNLGP